MREPRWGLPVEASGTGPSGRWWRLTLPDDRGDPEREAHLVLYMLHVPGAHVAWEWYFLGVTHLRPIDGTEPPVLHFPKATHEFVCLALDPAHEPDPLAPKALSPPSILCQVEIGGDDEADEVARKLAHASARGVVGGFMPIEPLGSARPHWDYWSNALANTVADIRSGRHS